MIQVINSKSRACAYSEHRGPSMEDYMAERGVGISVQAFANNLGIDPSTVTCTL